MPAHTSKLHIALVTETFPPEINGVAMTLHRLVSSLARRHRVTVFRPRQPSEAATERVRRNANFTEFLRPGLPVPGMGFQVGMFSTTMLGRWWRRDRPDLVHVATEGPLGVSALRAARALNLPVSSSFHTNFDDYTKHYGIGPLKEVVAGYLRRFHNRTRRTMVPSRDLMQALQRQGYRNLVLFARGVDTMMFSPLRRDQALRASWGAGEHATVLMTVGRVAWEKSLPLAIEAAARIRANHPDTVMVVVGDGPARAELQSRYPWVVWTGFRTGIELAQHYAAADLFLFPSMSETFGNVVLEAMASGVPAVAFDYAAPKRYIRHAGNGWLVPFGDEARFSEVAVGAAASPRTLRSFGEAARTTTLDIHWEQVIDGFESTLREVIAEHHGLPPEGREIAGSRGRGVELLTA